LYIVLPFHGELKFLITSSYLKSKSFTTYRVTL